MASIFLLCGNGLEEIREGFIFILHSNLESKCFL